ncbi:Nn.00g098400.m01.CDS01 [Neocucurbitaria sp. VM-36]
MEVVGAAASAVTLLGVAVKGTETLYNTISGFKNVSARTEALSSAIRNLRALLTQLQNDEAIAEDTPTLKNFRKLLKNYNVDVQRHAKDLNKIQASAQDSKKKQISKKLKGAISGDKELLRILAELTQCCTTLGTQLSLILNTTLTIRNDVLDLRVASSAQAIHDVNQSKMLLEQSTNVLAINGRIENVQTSVDGIQQAVMTMTQKMESIPQVSNAQSNDIRSLLLALQDQIAGLSMTSTNVPGAFQSTSAPDSETETRNEKEKQLKESIQRLQTLALQKEGNVHGEEAESLVTDLEYILKAISIPEDNEHVTAQKRRYEEYSAAESISIREVKRLCSMVALSHSIDFNAGHPRSKPCPRTKVSQKHRIEQVTAQEYDVTVALTRRTFSEPQDDNDQSMCQASKVETIAKLKVIEKSKYPTMLVAYLCHIQVQNGFSSLNPVISIGKMLPNDSPLFDIVMRGDVDELKRLLLQRQCTLWDRDSYGTPLLHYAMGQPAMCKFLIEHGADVDELAILVLGNFAELPGSVQFTWKVIAYYYKLEDLTDLFNHGKPFIDIESKNGLGETILLQVLSSNGVDGNTIELLLDKGADIHARDNQGLNCLHKVFQIYRYSHYKKDMEVLVVLIQRGADILAKDWFGRSIFDYAYECDHEGCRPTGSYRGDLWDAALARCGYEKYIRSPQTRLCHVTTKYTKEHFEGLWEGIEHECPYLSDPPVLCPQHDVITGDFKEWSDSDSAGDEEDETDQEEDQENDQEEEEQEERRNQVGWPGGNEQYLTDSDDDLSDGGHSGGILINID